MQEFGSYLRSLRGKRPLREIADKTGLSHTYIADIENGFRRGSNKPIKPSPDTLKKLAAVYDTSFPELMVKAGHVTEKDWLAMGMPGIEEDDTEFKAYSDHFLGKAQARDNNKTPDSFENERELVEQIELSDEELLNKFIISADGEKLSDQEARAILAFVRTLRQNR